MINFLTIFTTFRMLFQVNVQQNAIIGTVIKHAPYVVDPVKCGTLSWTGQENFPSVLKFASAIS